MSRVPHLSHAEHAEHAAFLVELLAAKEPSLAEVLAARAARHFERERTPGTSPNESTHTVCRPERGIQDTGVQEYYAPPYESPIEDRFARHAAPYWADATEVHKQFDVSTVYGSFRLDFVLEIYGLRVGIECDGKAFHDRERDTYRDTAILGSRKVDEIVRFRGEDLVRCVHDCLYILHQMNPRLFQPRSTHELERRASFGARRIEFNRESDLIEFSGPPLDDDDDDNGVEHQREILWRCWAARGMPTTWQYLYQMMLETVRAGATIDEVVGVMRARGIHH